MRKLLLFIIICYILLFSYIVITVTSKKIPHYEAHKGSNAHIVAHRGYSSLARENSLESIKIANNSDCVDLLEVDVRLTKDKVLVLSHNNNILKIGKKKFNISNITYNQLKNIKLIDDYKLPLNNFTLDRQTVVTPKLEDVLKEIDKYVIIDIKYNKNIKELNKALLSIVDEYDNVIIQSSNIEGLNDLYKRNKRMKYQFIIDSVEDYYVIPDYLYGVAVKHTYLKEKELKDLIDNGKKLFIWTVNDIKTYKKILSVLKTYGNRAYYITDYPEVLCTYDSSLFFEI